MLAAETGALGGVSCELEPERVQVAAPRLLGQERETGAEIAQGRGKRRRSARLSSGMSIQMRQPDAFGLGEQLRGSVELVDDQPNRRLDRSFGNVSFKPA